MSASLLLVFISACSAAKLSTQSLGELPSPSEFHTAAGPLSILNSASVNVVVPAVLNDSIALLTLSKSDAQNLTSAVLDRWKSSNGESSSVTLADGGKEVIGRVFSNAIAKENDGSYFIYAAFSNFTATSSTNQNLSSSVLKYQIGSSSLTSIIWKTAGMDHGMCSGVPLSLRATSDALYILVGDEAGTCRRLMKFNTELTLVWNRILLSGAISVKGGVLDISDFGSGQMIWIAIGLLAPPVSSGDTLPISFEQGMPTSTYVVRLGVDVDGRAVTTETSQVPRCLGRIPIPSAIAVAAVTSGKIKRTTVVGNNCDCSWGWTVGNRTDSNARFNLSHVIVDPVSNRCLKSVEGIHYIFQSEYVILIGRLFPPEHAGLYQDGQVVSAVFFTENGYSYASNSLGPSVSDVSIGGLAPTMLYTLARDKYHCSGYVIEDDAARLAAGTKYRCEYFAPVSLHEGAAGPTATLFKLIVDGVVENQSSTSAAGTPVVLAVVFVCLFVGFIGCALMARRWFLGRFTAFQVGYHRRDRDFELAQARRQRELEENARRDDTEEDQQQQ